LAIDAEAYKPEPTDPTGFLVLIIVAISVIFVPWPVALFIIPSVLVWYGIYIQGKKEDAETVEASPDLQ